MSILDAVATREAAEAGIAQVAENTNEAWKAVAFEAGVNVAGVNPFFTADQIWEELDKRTDVPSVHNRSAMGPVMRELQGAAFIAPTGDFERSIRPATHGRPLPVWKSLVMK